MGAETKHDTNKGHDPNKASKDSFVVAMERGMSHDSAVCGVCEDVASYLLIVTTPTMLNLRSASSCGGSEPSCFTSESQVATSLFASVIKLVGFFLYSQCGFSLGFDHKF